MRGLLIIGAVAALGSCSSQEQAQADKLKAQVAAKMKDPESARFTHLKVHLAQLCGEVNAKNSFGGYEGAERFSVVDGSVQLRSSAERADDLTANTPAASHFIRQFDQDWQSCQSAGVAVE
ncbi:hypothetical protein [Sphingobium fuliginis]|uniref:Lipoprotein n=1 Tax=Sphingobium fuliginis ATCC 27551 TaxID=1208342 RepID=A0A5B8CGJ1_SPHSA|nr:hypothetical protein [Sphingobium fuliginis]QDC37100.1 hypothetical protein FIL70_07560 [Sphingobium fuliginis ATCC 27551]